MKSLFLLLALLTSFAANAGTAPAKPAVRRHHGLHLHKMLNGRILLCRAHR